MDKVNWTQVIVFGGVALLVLLIGLSLLPFGWGGGWGPWGMMGRMMGPGMPVLSPVEGMGGWPGSTGGGSWGVLGWLFPLIGLLIPLGFLALLVAGGVWLFRQVNAPQGPAGRPPRTGSTENIVRAGAPEGETCPSCDRRVQADWQLCPYCGQELV